MSTAAPTLAAAVGRPADRRWALPRPAETCASRPNIVPANTSALYHRRTPYLESLQQRKPRVRASFEAGALSAGSAHEVTQVFPVPAAACCVATTGLGRSSLSSEDERDRQTGRTGMGNVAQGLPVINPTIAIVWGDAVNHQLEFTTACATPSADRGVRDGALALVTAAGGAV